MNTTPALPRHGTVDLQVNGYAGVDFNQDNVSVAQIRQACERMAADGVAAFLGTIITAQPEVRPFESMLHCMASPFCVRADSG